MPDTLALATELRARGDADLAVLLDARNISPEARIDDFFDLAEALLSSRSIRHALQRLDRPTLAVIALVVERPGDADDLDARLTKAAPAVAGITPSAQQPLRHAVDLALLRPTDEGFVAYDAVRDALRESEADGQLPSRDDLLRTGPPVSDPSTAPQQTDPALAASESAWNATVALAELVAELQKHPVRELGRGGLSAPDAKLLALAMRVDAGAVTPHLQLAARAGLVAQEAGSWGPTASADGWLTGSARERWQALVGAWLSGLSPQVRQTLGRVPDSRWDDELVRYAEWLYPAGQSWIHEAVEHVASQAAVLGLTVSGTLSPAGRAALASGAAAAADEVARYFPDDVDRVYLQHDLTVISPGPLRSDLDLRLRSMADIESRAQASTYRFTEASIERALGGGESADGILRFLAELSLTGVPQPLHYLVTQAAERFGAIRVGPLEDQEAGSPDAGARSYVRSESTAFISQLAVDQALSALGLHQTGPHRLISRFDYEVVFWTLRDAHYPVAAETIDGELVGLRRPRGRERGPAGRPRERGHEQLIARLRSSADEGSGADGPAWIARQLDAAIEARSTVTVMVDVPGSGPMPLTLEPTGIGGGRLRGRDRTADIERTLPLSSIIELRTT